MTRSLDSTGELKGYVDVEVTKVSSGVVRWAEIVIRTNEETLGPTRIGVGSKIEATITFRVNR